MVQNILKVHFSIPEGHLRDDWKQNIVNYILRHQRKRFIQHTPWEILDSNQLLHFIYHASVIEDSVEVVHADSSFNIATADPEVWHGLGLRCISGEIGEGEILKMAYFKLVTIQEIGFFTRMQVIADTVYYL